MNYRLAVLTHAQHDERPAIQAFLAHVEPQPAVIEVFRDIAPQRGFCAATARLWRMCASAPQEWIVWLEHDFRLCRPVHLRDLAAVMDERPWLFQMALMRDAYSTEEHAAGGLFELRRDDFAPRAHVRGTNDMRPWLQMPWFTTNPSLMRRQFMADHPFPDDGQEHCEGRFGIALAEQGYTFGTWGSGEVWCNHVGVRDGSGHGY